MKKHTKGKARGTTLPFGAKGMVHEKLVVSGGWLLFATNLLERFCSFSEGSRTRKKNPATKLAVEADVSMGTIPKALSRDLLISLL